MIHHVQGNLLESDCDIIGHQSNCVMGFGSGIAGQIRKQLPGAYRVFAKDNRSPDQKIGDCVYATEDIGDFMYVFNLYGQMYCGGAPGVVYTIYEALEAALVKMMTRIDHDCKDQNLKIGVPYKMGCGLAGGDWPTVEAILNRVSTKFGRDIFVYEFNP